MKLNFLFLSATSLLLSSSFCHNKLDVNGVRLSKKRIDNNYSILNNDQDSTSHVGTRPSRKRPNAFEALSSGAKWWVIPPIPLVSLRKSGERIQVVTKDIFQLVEDLYSGDQVFTLQSESGEMKNAVFVRDVLSVDREFLSDVYQFKYTFKTAFRDDFQLHTDAGEYSLKNIKNEKWDAILFAFNEMIRREKIKNKTVGNFDTKVKLEGAAKLERFVFDRYNLVNYNYDRTVNYNRIHQENNRIQRESI